jgi:hypothetical protein
MIAANGRHGRLDLEGDEFEPKLLDVMDDDEGELVVLLGDGLLGAEKSIELQVSRHKCADRPDRRSCRARPGSS